METEQKKRFLFGGDYNPEQWLEEPSILEEDIRLFHEAHINVVTLGVFSWSMLEPQEGVYDFTWLRQIIDRLYENGISVILATPSGARPKWLSDRYPEVLRTDRNRIKAIYGMRHNHCFTSPVYRQKVAEIDRRLAEEFGNHPAVILWHISNEFGGDCHCELCQKAFQNWVRERYQTIDEVNRRWSTTFWSHRLQSFEQIESPSDIGEPMLHGLNLDWNRFVTDQTTDFMKMEIQAVRQGGSTLPVTTNFMYDFPGLDYTVLAKELDIVSWDNYPNWHKREEWDTALRAGLIHDQMRTFQKKPFLMMESSPTQVNWKQVSRLKKPGILMMEAVSAIAHGADSVCYFQMRQSVGASEKLHGSVIDHSGRSDTRVFQEVKAVGEMLEAVREIQGTQVHAEAAVVMDRVNRWANDDIQGPRNAGMKYKELLRQWYDSLQKKGIDTDVITMKDDLSSYKLVILPMEYMITDAFAEKVRNYVQNGGRLIMTYWSGIVDENDRCWLGDAPHGLTDVLGIHREEIDPLYDGEYNELRASDGRTYRCDTFCERIHADSAQVLYRYGSDFYAGEPAVTVNPFGKGQAWYIASFAEPAFSDDLIAEIIEECHLKTPGFPIPEGVAARRRCSETAEYLFLQNYGHQTRQAEPGSSWTILYGSTEMKPFEACILKRLR